MFFSIMNLNDLMIFLLLDLTKPNGSNLTLTGWVELNFKAILDYVSLGEKFLNLMRLI